MTKGPLDCSLPSGAGRQGWSFLTGRDRPFHAVFTCALLYVNMSCSAFPPFHIITKVGLSFSGCSSPPFSPRQISYPVGASPTGLRAGGVEGQCLPFVT